MDEATRLPWIAVALASVAAIIQPFALLEPLFLGLICVSMCLVAAGVVIVQRGQRDVEEAVTLQNRWREQRDRCKPCRVERSYIPAPPALVPPPAPEPVPVPPQNENPVTTGRDLIFEEAER